MDKQALDDLQNLITKISGIKLKSLVRTEELGSQSDFSEEAEDFKGIIQLFKELEKVNLNLIPYYKLFEIISEGKSVLQNFDQIKNYDPEGRANTKQLRIQLLKELFARHKNLFDLISPIISYSSREETRLESFKKEAVDLITEIKNIRTQANKESSQTQIEVKDILNQIKDTAGKAGVAKYAIHFKNEADSHRTRAKYWLLATGILALLTVLYGAGILYYYLKIAPSFDTKQAIQLGIAKLVIFAVLYFALIWSGRMYKAQLHNHVVNQHRQNALNTFETFVKAASDDQTKNAVLIQATVSIFSPQHTGFSTLEAEPSASPKILEIIRSVMGGPKE